jgi:hypothetical protein
LVGREEGEAERTEERHGADFGLAEHVEGDAAEQAERCDGKATA